MQAILPFVSFPYPRSASYNVRSESTTLRWVSSRNADSKIIYFGKEKNPPLMLATKENSFSPGTLQTNSRYYWRIDEVIGRDTLVGPLWHFTTQ